MTMTVGELRVMIDGLDDSVVVRMATGPSYPHVHEVKGLKLVNPSQGEIEEVSDALAESRAGGDNLTPEEVEAVERRLKELEAVPEVLYVVEGAWESYGDRDLWSL